MIKEDIKYSEILRENSELAKVLPDKSYEIKILSNIITSQVNEILEYTLRLESIPAIVKSGNYDNIVQDSSVYNNSDLCIIFWELCNIINGFQYKIELLTNRELEDLKIKMKTEIDLVIRNLQKASLVIFNQFSSLAFSTNSIISNNYKSFSDELNQYLKDRITDNIRIVEIDNVLANIGLQKCLDERNYYSSKALYTVEFFRSYTEYVKPYIMSANGKAKKILIFDCDNTLWKGVLGEDGIDNIEMSSDTNNGCIFSEIQDIALALNRQGVLIGLCSKNNIDDIDEVIGSHPNMKIKDENISIKKCNWSDKVSNLREIAEELNIGLDSILFIDDSSFEINFVNEQLPEITTLQVPERIYNYPRLLRENIRHFYNLSSTDEDRKKNSIYRQQSKRKNDQKRFSNIEDYLVSLNIEVKMYENIETIIPRVSQMSLKTNQFNLTTNRYTENDIKKFNMDKRIRIYAFSVTDKFGDSGITGLSIIKLITETKTAEIDTFLMSCRIIGRNIEYAFINNIITRIKKEKFSYVKANYIKTNKNDQVKNFYDSCSFKNIESNKLNKKYILDLSKYEPKLINYIRIENAK